MLTIYAYASFHSQQRFKGVTNNQLSAAVLYSGKLFIGHLNQGLGECRAPLGEIIGSTSSDGGGEKKSELCRGVH